MVLRDGTWTENLIYEFQGGADGSNPGSVLVGPAGTLYGTTLYGGAGTCTTAGCGTVFQLTPPAQQGGTWTKQVIYSFQNDHDGIFPGGLIADQLRRILPAV